METPTPVLSLDELNEPVLRPEDSTFPAQDPTQIIPNNRHRTDYRSMDTHAPTAEELASHGIGVGNDSPPTTPLEAPYLTKEMGGLHRQLLRNLLANQDSSPSVSPLATRDSIVRTTTPTSAIEIGEPTQWQPTENLESADGIDSPDSGSELGESDIVFSPPVTPESGPLASDLEEYFPNVSDTNDEYSADRELSKLDLSDISSCRSLDTVCPASGSLEEVAQERLAELAEPAVMMTSDIPDPTSELDDLDFGNFEAESSDSPPPSRTPLSTHSEASSLVLLAVSDGSVSKLPFDVVSVDNDDIVVSIGSK